MIILLSFDDHFVVIWWSFVDHWGLLSETWTWIGSSSELYSHLHFLLFNLFLFSFHILLVTFYFYFYLELNGFLIWVVKILCPLLRSFLPPAISDKLAQELVSNIVILKNIVAVYHLKEILPGCYNMNIDWISHCSSLLSRPANNKVHWPQKNKQI